MAFKKIDLSALSLKAIANQGYDLNSLNNLEFSEIINNFIIAGTKKMEISKENELLLENILNLAKELNKKEEIQENLKQKLKELNKELIESV